MQTLQKELDDLWGHKGHCERLESERGASGGSRGCVHVLFFRPLPVSILIIHF
jgi:hypothetical protein